MKSFLIAAGLAIVGGLALVGWSCRADSRDACLIAQGMGPYVAGVLLVVLWPLVAGVLVIIRAWNQPPPEA